MRWLYTCCLHALLPFAWLRLCWKGIADRGYWRHIPERFARGYGAARADRRPVVCVHAVSVGEALAARAVIRFLRAEFPDHMLVMTTVTPGGRKTAEREYGDEVECRYLPYDLPWVVRRFLDRCRPRLFLVMETEIWPNLFAQCAARGIPLLLLNARLSEKSAASYRRWPWLFRPTMRRITQVVAQSEADAERFAGLGVPQERIQVSGNLKYAIPVHRREEVDSEARLRFAGRRRIWIAGSTHPGEEDILLRAHAALRRKYPDLLLILVPRHIGRAKAVLRLCQRAGMAAAARTVRSDCPADAGVFLWDTLGELERNYALSDVAFVGGSFARIGGHNVLEPICRGVPTVVGPHMWNFRSIVADLLPTGALRQAQDEKELHRLLENALSDGEDCTMMIRRAQDFISSQADSVPRTEDILRKRLNAEVPAVPEPNAEKH